MTTWEALLLGIVQGLTEFLPISSSGHLQLSQYLLGYQKLHHYVLFNLICHLGTLCAIVWIFYPAIKQTLQTKKRLWQLGLATLPLFPLVFVLKPLKMLFDQPAYLGIWFLLSASLIFIGSKYSLMRLPKPSTIWKDCFTIGLFQAIAVFPGVSRSGATISAARFLGWPKEEAVTFSFLLAIPAILGGITLEILQYFFSSSTSITPVNGIQFLIGFISSFGIGCLALRFLQGSLVQNHWRYFGWYCLLIGLFTILYFNFFDISYG